MITLGLGLLFTNKKGLTVKCWNNQALRILVATLGKMPLFFEFFLLMGSSSSHPSVPSPLPTLALLASPEKHVETKWFWNEFAICRIWRNQNLCKSHCSKSPSNDLEFIKWLNISVINRCLKYQFKYFFERKKLVYKNGCFM